MDLENQRRVKELAEKYGVENCVVLLGASEAESAALAAETVTTGDPTFAGPLAEVDESVYDDQIGMMEMVLDCDAIIEAVSEIRNSL